MGETGSSSGRATWRAAIVGSFAAVAGFALLHCGVAAASDTHTTDFQTFMLGSVNGQQGWTSGPEFDEEIVNVADFYPGGVPELGMRAFRMSNFFASASFGIQPLSPPLGEPASESGDNTEFIAQFTFITARKSGQPGATLNISPTADLASSRMSFVGLTDTTAGTDVNVFDTAPNGDFVNHSIGRLTDGVPHTIKFWIKLHPGPHNDLVRIFIDGRDVGQDFSTWESYYRGIGQEPPAISRLLFRANVANASVEGGGFLFGGVTTTADDGPGPEGSEETVDKHASTRTVKPGGHVSYTITARNRGRAIARNLLVCDHIPSEERFVRADHRLLHRGNERCLVIRSLRGGHHVTLHLATRVDTNAHAGEIDNQVDETEGAKPPAKPPAGTVPGRVVRPRPVARADAVVNVLGPPRFTG